MADFIGDFRIGAALADVPAGRWVVGVSGGADSVALLRALRASRADIALEVAHLDHGTRNGESQDDAAFVAALARSLGLRFHIDRIDAGDALLPSTEARFRAARQAFFARIVNETGAQGVLLAHHADDRAETILFRLLRGGEISSFNALRREAIVVTPSGPLRILRPLLGVRHAEIEAFLHAIGQSWREDRTNASDQFARNRIRAFLRARPELVEGCLRLGDAADEQRTWVRENAPSLPVSFDADTLADLPELCARASARRWLIEHGCPPGEVTGEVAGRLIEMCRDRATPARRDFPGGVRVHRRGGRIECLP